MSHTHIRIQFPTSWMRETSDLLQNTWFQTEASMQISGQVAREVGVVEDDEAASGGQGNVTVW